MGQPAVDEESKRYLAGYLDGRGSISITEDQRAGERSSPRFTLAVEFTSVSDDLLSLLHDFFGGHLAWKACRQLWILRLQNRRAEHLLRAVRPYSLIKSPQIDIALAFRETFGGEFPKGRRPLPRDILTLRRDLAARLSHSRL